MSVQFKKPKKRMQMRVFANDEEDDERERNAMEVDEDIPPPPPAPIINKKEKSKENKIKTKQTLLSFGDEVEEDDSTFQVKKSSQSKKLMKMLDRERRGFEKKSDKEKIKKKGKDEKESNSRYNIDENNDYKKDYSSNKETKSVEGVILTGRAAVSAIRSGDVSGSEDEEEHVYSRTRGAVHDDDLANVEGSERFRHAFVKHSGMSVRAVLDSGGIPDAALIHAARKKRQQARQVGEFIPIQSTRESTIDSPPHKAVGGSRLVREDGEGDGSDEDPDRIDVKGVQTNHSKRERIKMAASQNGSDPDSGGEEWENQQIRKAVTHNQIIAAQQETYYNNSYVMPTIAMADVELNPFAIAPAAVTEMGLSNEHLRPLATSGQVMLTPVHLADVLRSRLNVLKNNKSTKFLEYDEMATELNVLKEKKESCTIRAPLLAKRYEFYQKLRAYITDLIECLDEKMPSLVALESRAMTLQRRKSSYLVERRRADVRDQAQEVLQPIAGKKDVKDEERSRRAAEREGRRVRRRRAREKEGVKGREGDSSDDEVPQVEIVAYQSIQDQIMNDASLLFSDALEEFSTLAGVLSKMEEWRSEDMPAYVEAYAGMCLPKLIGPFLRLKLLLWNPITDEDALDWEKMQWYRGLMLYGLSGTPETEENLAEDPDISMIPNVVFKVIIPKLTDLVEGSWDPVSSSQTRRLSALLRKAATLPGLSPNSKSMTTLADAIIKRAQSTLQHDVFIPILPKSIVDVSGSGKSGAALFLRRQSTMAVKLLSNLASLHSTVSDVALAPLALTGLLQRYLLPALRCCPASYAAELCWVITCSLPKAWLSIDGEQTPIQQFINVCHEIQLQLTDNIINLKPLDLVRNSITTLKNGSSG